MLKNNKAAGMDGILGEMLKGSPDGLLLVILKIMNKIKEKNHYPEKWASGIVTLLLKSGDDEDPDNYRAITVIDALAKILAIMLNEKIEKWLTEQTT